ncbi:Ig-like domain-containing protein, partial [Vagococcus bubulae]
MVDETLTATPITGDNQGTDGKTTVKFNPNAHTVNINPVKVGDKELTGKGTPGDTVILKNQKGETVGQVVVDKDGHYKVENPNVTLGDVITATPTIGDHQGTPTTAIVGGVDGGEDGNIGTPDSHKPTINQPTEGDTTVSGTGTPGDTIIIKDKDGKELGKGTVGKDSKFEISVNRPLVVDEPLIATPMTGDNQGTDGKTTVKFNPNAHTVNINPVKVGDKELTGKGTPGDTIILKNQKGETLGQVIVDKDGHYKVENPNVTLGDVITATPTIGDHQGTPTTAIVGGVDGGEDGNIGTPDSHKPTINQPTEGDTTVSGTGTPGDTIIIKDKDGKELGKGTVGKDKTFNITVNRPLVVDETLTATPMTGGNQGTDDTTTVAFDPNGHTVSINPVKVGDKELTGKGTPGDTVILKNQNGETLGQVIVDKDGHYKVENPNVTLGDVITATPTIGDHQGTPTTAIVGGVDGGEDGNMGTPDSHKPTINQPTEGDTTVTGTGTPGDTVVITDKDGNKLGEGVVDGNGDYSIPVTNLPSGEEITATPSINGNVGTSSTATVLPKPEVGGGEAEDIGTPDSHKPTINQP